MEEIARIIEVFTSIQGEGIYVGQPHLFVRFWDCNLACGYCDTDYRGPYREYTLAQLQDQVSQRIRTEGPHQAVSLTGGEPLLWWKFLKAWLPQLKALHQRTYLETNGVLADNLAQVLAWIDVIAMDIKPPSATGDRPVWEEHDRFLRTARQAGKEIFVKIVVTGATSDSEMDQAFEQVAAVDPRIPLVLQPVTPPPFGGFLWQRQAGGIQPTSSRLAAPPGLPPKSGGVTPPPFGGFLWQRQAGGIQPTSSRLAAPPGLPPKSGGVTPWGAVQEPPSADQLGRWRRRAADRLADVRIIPQVHRMLGIP